MTKKKNKKKWHGTCYTTIGRPSIDIELKEMRKLVTKISYIRSIRSAILSSCAYHSVNEEEQVLKASRRGNLTTEELELLKETYKEQNEIGNNLMEKWHDYKKHKKTKT